MQVTQQCSYLANKASVSSKAMASTAVKERPCSKGGEKTEAVDYGVSNMVMAVKHVTVQAKIIL